MTILANHMLLTTESPIIVNRPDSKFKTLLFLPEGEGRKGEGGLRTKGYFKHSYRLVDNLWYICDTEGNPVRPAPEDIQESIKAYVNGLQDSSQEPINYLPLISVITVVLNGERYLEETIQSVINQTYPNVEYIIIDGGSTDGTLDIIKKYEDKIDYWVSEKDKGIYDAMNKGIRVASGFFVTFLNSDDYYSDYEYFKVAVAEYLKKNWDICCASMKIILDSKKYVIRPSSTKGIKYKMDLNHPTMIYRTEIFRKVGLFDMKHRIAADYEHLLRTFKDLKKVEVYIYKKQVVDFRFGGESSRFWETNFDVFKIHIKYWGIIYAVWRFLINMLKYMLMRLFGYDNLIRIKTLAKIICKRH